jgi:hypothetical protein
MIKKILLGALILGIIAFAIIGYGTYKIADEALKEQEPKLRQYVQMDEAAQNQYVLENIEELLSKIDVDENDPADKKEKWERIRELNAQPEIQSALINVGRSFTASVIMISSSIVEEMTPETKEKYEKEAKEFEARMEKYKDLVNAADPTLGFGEE